MSVIIDSICVACCFVVVSLLIASVCFVVSICVLFFHIVLLLLFLSFQIYCCCNFNRYIVLIIQKGIFRSFQVSLISLEFK